MNKHDYKYSLLGLEIDLSAEGADGDIEERLDDEPGHSWRDTLRGDIYDHIDSMLMPAIPAKRSMPTGAPDEIALQRHLIRAKKKGSAADLTLSQWKSIVTVFRFQCVYCGYNDDDSGYMHMDHMVPIHRGGGTTWRNVVPACKTCNSKKGSKDLVTWLRSEFSDADETLHIISETQKQLEARFRSRNASA